MYRHGSSDVPFHDIVRLERRNIDQLMQLFITIAVDIRSRAVGGARSESPNDGVVVRGRFANFDFFDKVGQVGK